jgi:hypothetical protein
MPTGITGISLKWLSRQPVKRFTELTEYSPNSYARAEKPKFLTYRVTLAGELRCFFEIDHQS